MGGRKLKAGEMTAKRERDEREANEEAKMFK